MKKTVTNSLMLLAFSGLAEAKSWGDLAADQGVSQVSYGLIFLEAICLLGGIAIAAISIVSMYRLKTSNQSPIPGATMSTFLLTALLGGCLAGVGAAVEYSTGTVFGDSTGTESGLQKLRSKATSSIEHQLPAIAGVSLPPGLVVPANMQQYLG